MTTEVFRLKQILQDKAVLNHRKVSQVINDCCSQVLKKLVEKIEQLIEQKRDMAELSWQTEGDIQQVQ